VVAVYSTFFCRGFDQANLDVGLHGLPVVFVLDRAGITGDDGPSHHGILDLALTLAIPGMTVLAPSSAEELEAMLETALGLPGPSVIRFPKTRPRHVGADEVGVGLAARRVRAGDGSVCLVGVGKLLAACEEASAELASAGIDATVWDPRVVNPPDPALLADLARHRLVVTAEDGVRFGGAGMFLVDAAAGVARRSGGPVPASLNLGVPQAYLPQAKADDILSALGLDGPGIAASVRQALGARAAPGANGARGANGAPAGGGGTAPVDGTPPEAAGDPPPTVRPSAGDPAR
jgi:1-deoxy-D-xylulose-5-phosphate synthase